MTEAVLTARGNPCVELRSFWYKKRRSRSFDRQDIFGDRVAIKAMGSNEKHNFVHTEQQETHRMQAIIS